jgi:hypothetical protein
MGCECWITSWWVSIAPATLAEDLCDARTHYVAACPAVDRLSPAQSVGFAWDLPSISTSAHLAEGRLSTQSCRLQMAAFRKDGGIKWDLVGGSSQPSDGMRCI